LKGQFMLISSIVIGLIVISVASTISEVQKQEFNNRETAYHLEMIKDEAAEDLNTQKERENFKKMVSMLPQSTRTEYSYKNSCFNVTVISTDQRLRLNCIS